MSINVCNDRSMASITSLPSGVSGSSLVLISEQTASSSATIDFTSGIDSTYKEYIFKFINCHPSFDGGQLSIKGSTDGGTSFGLTKTTTFFNAQHTESDSTTSLAYAGGKDLAQSTGRQYLGYGTGNDDDEVISGTLQIFNPSSTTFVKHFIVTSNTYHQSNYSINAYVGGYFNTTSAINGIRFDFDNGTIDSGTIKLYGVV